MPIIEIDPDEFGISGDSAPALELRRISEASDVADGVSTLNEQTTLNLKHHGIHGARLWLGDDGFALLRGHDLDLAVHPDSRGQGLGTELARLAVTAFTDRAETAELDAWSHADHPAAGRIAARLGIPRARELRIMARPTALPVDVPTNDGPTNDGVSVRSYLPSDRDAIVEINARAFAHHREQGAMSVENFTERTEEPWFDPAGLLVAVDDATGTVLGFHWTKVHRDETPPFGEVYVVAVSPRAAGRGIGKVLTAAGLSYLASVDPPIDQVILYVDGDNEPAIGLYEGLGFILLRTEAQYRGRPAPSPLID